MASVAGLGYTPEDISELRWSGLNTPDAQSVVHHKPTVYTEMLGRALESTSEYPALESQKQASVKFDLAPMPQSFNLPAVLSVYINRVGASPQSLVAAVELLVSIIDENKHQSLASLTTEDYQRLAKAQDKLINIVGEDENHLLAPLVNFIGNLVRNPEEKSNPLIEERHRRARRPKRDTSSADRPRVKLANLLPQEIESTEDGEDVNSLSLKPRRPEHVGRPANRPRVKLTDLLAREAEHIAAGEVDTEIPVDNEV